MSKEKVLIVDDEVELAATLSERLQLRGYGAVAAYSAEEGMNAVRALSPDVVILDLNLPGEGGIGILKKIKRSSPSIQVILTTGHGEIQSEEEGLSAGAFSYITKPFDISELMEQIDKAVAADE